MSKGILASALVALLAAAVIAGCGGGDDSSSGTGETTALTKAEFIEQADAICAEANEQSETEAEEFAEENGFVLEKASQEQLEEAISDVLVPSLAQQADEVAALGAPEGDEDRIDAIVTSLEDAVAQIEDDPISVFEGEPLKESRELAADYGFKVCGAE